jgi:hypothetical protein
VNHIVTLLSVSELLRLRADSSRAHSDDRVLVQDSDRTNIYFCMDFKMYVILEGKGYDYNYGVSGSPMRHAGSRFLLLYAPSVLCGTVEWYHLQYLTTYLTRITSW